MGLNIDAARQVAYLRDEKDVAFNHMAEDQAVRFLSDRNYFFKLKAFAKNYDKRFKDDGSKGRYIGLDFAYLVELSRIDKQLRDLVLHLTLDIEHYLKVRINRAAMASGCDPSALDYSRDVTVEGQISRVDSGVAAQRFAEMAAVLDTLDGSLDEEAAVSTANELANILDDVTGGFDPNHVRNSYAAMGSSSYSKGIVEKYGQSAMPYWCLMELMSFGPLIGFYKACFRKDGLIDDAGERETLKVVKNLLRRAQALRNAAAHGDCLLNGLAVHSKGPSTNGVKRMLREREGLSGSVVDQVSSVSVAMDLAATLMCYDVIVPAGLTKSAAAEELRCFAARAAANEGWFERNYSVKSFIDFVSLMSPYFAHKFDCAAGGQTETAWC